MLFLGALGGCSVLPAAGPSQSVMESVGTSENTWYKVVEINEQTISVLRLRRPPSMTRLSEYKRAVAPVVGIGDVIKITVWEAAPGNLFNASAGTAGGIGAVGSTAIPEQVVSREGTISVPFAGVIKVIGKQPREIEQAIVSKLSNKAVDPQALVNVVNSAENSVTVTGDAVAGGQVQLGPNNERLLNAIAATGGIKTPVHETFVSLTRGGKVVTVPFLELTREPAENIRLSSYDVIGVYGHKRSYTILGASGRQAEIAFDAPTITLAQAIGRAGGLNDDKAEAKGVYVFRFEPADLIPQPFREPNLAHSDQVPIIYRLDLSRPEGLFLAQAFAMREGDIVYVANSSGADFTKLLRIVGTAVSPAVSAANVYSAVP